MKSPSPQGSARRQPAGVQVAILQFAELFEGLDEVQFWIKDRRGRYLHVNRAFLLNYDLTEPSQVVGRTDYDLSPAFLADQFLLDDERVLKGHKVVGRIELVGSADQTSQWNVTHKLPLLDARGRITGTTGTTRPLKSGERSLGSSHGLEAVLLRIRDGYHGPLTNAELASLAGLSVRAFERKFLQAFHVPPQQYLRKLRVRMACRALVFTDRPLAQVAMECGFADQSHFGHEFRKQTGRTPKGYREHYGK